MLVVGEVGKPVARRVHTDHRRGVCRGLHPGARHAGATTTRVVGEQCGGSSQNLGYQPRARARADSGDGRSDAPSTYPAGVGPRRPTPARIALPPRRICVPLSVNGWHKSTYSGDFEDACVEAQARPDHAGVLIRDSKDRHRIPVVVSATAWSTGTRWLAAVADEPPCAR
ncbi:DUF397 domain-containing protein [Streptomyces sp. NPDC102441]|uniref:DUF397 domain-containing protein n=1 Tax=Streptomyces sp. NPDC102441 TaxID=3366176 RepID=UPI00380866DB